MSVRSARNAVRRVQYVSPDDVASAGSGIDHTTLLNIGVNTHAQIDTHITTPAIHFLQGSIDHTAILNIGSNDHGAIDTHIADTDIHFSDAPADSNDYGRNNNAWAIISASVALDDITDVTLTSPATGGVLYKSAGDWIDTTAITIDPTAEVELSYNGTRVFRTNVNGIYVYDVAGDDPNISLFSQGDVQLCSFYIFDGDMEVFNQVNSGLFNVRMKNSGGTNTLGLVCDPDADTTLYFTGIRTAATIVQGLAVFDTTGDDPNLQLQLQNGTNLASFYNLNGETFIQSNVISGTFTQRGNNASTVQTIGIISDPDAGVELYFTGTKEFETKAGGVIVDDELEINGDLNHDGTNIGFYGTAPAAQSSAYTRDATIVEDRTLLQSSAATATNNNNVLAALIADLQAIGVIG